MSVGFTKSFGVIVLLGVFLGGCATDGSMDATGGGGSSASSASTKNIDRIASGAVEDSLNACLARIPKDASAGQKMLAEESCRRDQANRR
jgi:hypothetical protein